VVRRRPARHPAAFTNLEVLASVAAKERSWRPWVPVALLLAALATATAALARPHVSLPARVDNATVVLLVDVSGSMRAADVEPTRLDAATAAMRTFLDRLPGRFKVGLVQFSAEAYVLAEPSHERDRVREALGYLEADAGTAIGDGLALATRVARESVAAGGGPTRDETVPGAIVLLSDGTQSIGRLGPLEGAQRARAAAIPVYTVALGTPEGVVRVPPGSVLLRVPPDPPLMRAIAERTNGETFTATTADRLGDVFAKLGSSIGRRTESREVTSWFALAAAALLVAAVGASRLLGGALDSIR
jgi:Ca-activated chloride channel family protein